MPYVEDAELNGFIEDDVPFPQIGTDLFDGISDDDEEPLGSGPVVPDILQVETVETVVRLDNDGSDDEIPQGNGVNEEENDDEDIPMDAPAPAKKRARASGASTPSAAGRKRKVSADSAEEPTSKRGRGRATAAVASSAIKKGFVKRAGAAPGSAKKAIPKATGKKPGRKPGTKAKEEEFEVEEIVEHKGSGKSTKFLVKWKGYEDDENTWEPKSNLAHAADVLKAYEATVKEGAVATSKKRAAPAKKAAKAVPATKTSTKPVARPGRPAGRPKRS